MIIIIIIIIMIITGCFPDELCIHTVNIIKIIRLLKFIQNEIRFVISIC